MLEEIKRRLQNITCTCVELELVEVQGAHFWANIIYYLCITDGAHYIETFGSDGPLCDSVKIDDHTFFFLF